MPEPISQLLLWLLTVVALLAATTLVDEVRRNGGDSNEVSLVGQDAPIGVLQLDEATIPSRDVEEVVILFVTGSCSTCTKLIKSMRRSRWVDGSVTLVVVCRGTRAECQRYREEEWTDGAVWRTDRTGSMAGAFGIRRYPAAVIVDRATIRRVGNPLTAEELDELWSHDEPTARARASSPGRQVERDHELVDTH